MRKKIVAGNWKMNLNYKDALSLYNDLKGNAEKIKNNVQVIIAPPSVYLSEFAQVSNSKVALAAQNCNEHQSGAYTGEISVEMLSSLKIKYCLVGHSERRAYYGETNELLKQKVDVLLSQGITPIYCFGEELKDRENANHFDLVKTQLTEALFHLKEDEIKKVVLAYEPVWAIGTGVTASSDQAQEMHSYVRKILVEKYSQSVADEISILYGGSCKPTNAKELFSNPDVDGGLIGGAALKADSFISIIEAIG